MFVRAGIDESVMVVSVGIKVYRVLMLVFGFGAFSVVALRRWTSDTPRLQPPVAATS